jgi:membrane carboxypeptidase/penicillin-binding protein PbpC
MRAGPNCPRVTEWYAPGTEPAAECDWHHDGVLTLPALYAEWAAKEELTQRASIAPPPEAERHAATQEAARFRIVSPQDGDRYSIPPGVPARYATVALLATGANAVTWYVDGQPIRGTRLPLTPGSHVIRAESQARRDAPPDQDEVHVLVE